MVKTEDLYTSTAMEIFTSLADFLRLGDETGFAEALFSVSPANRSTPPNHATGQLRVADPVGALGPRARAFYDEHFAPFEAALGYA
ncbi:MAG: hypothetical protein ACFE0P_06075 [Oceanicaulis sp.]